MLICLPVYALHAKKTELAGFVPGGDFAQYVQSQQCDGTYADHLLIKAFCNKISCTVEGN